MTFLLVSIGAKMSIYNKSQDNKQYKLKIGKLKEIWGDRLQITGDFNGDGQTDTLKEEYISTITNQETNKYYEGIEYDSMVSLTIQKKPFSLLKFSSSKPNPLKIETKTWQLFGLAYLKNEGDLDKNGTDEIGLIINWADWSNINFYCVYSYIDNSWKQVLTFEIRDFDLDKDKAGHYIDTSFNGFLKHNKKGELRAKTYELGDKIEKKVKLNNN